jgi:hypothetical protein
MEEGTQSFFLINRDPAEAADDDNDEHDGFTRGPYMKASAVRNCMKARITDWILLRRSSFFGLKNPDEAVAERTCNFFEEPEAEGEESFMAMVGARPEVAAEADL